ncbi:MAG: tetratricopeptide repeat protein [Bacteroidia bacterium]
MKRLTCFLILNFAGPGFAAAQNSIADSLNGSLKFCVNDTQRMRTLNLLSLELINTGNYNDALLKAEEAEKLGIKLRNVRSLGTCYTNTGMIYDYQSNYPRALEYYQKALQKCEEEGDQKRIGNCLTNIGIVYSKEKNYAKALEYFEKDLHICEKLAASHPDAKNGLARCYGNMGAVYADKKDFARALEYHFKSLTAYGNTTDPYTLGSNYNNIGAAYHGLGEFIKSREYFNRALEKYLSIKDQFGIATCYINLASSCIDERDYSSAISCSEKGLSIAFEIEDVEGMSLCYDKLAKAYAETGDYRRAYVNHRLFKQFTDSIFNSNNSKQLSDLRTSFEVEKKEAELKVKSEAEQGKLKAVAEEEQKRQQIIIAAVAGVLLVVVLFSIFLFKRFRITQKQKLLIEEQKTLVDEAYEKLHEKNKEVMDSIHYARKIQQALLTPEKYIERAIRILRKNS